MPAARCSGLYRKMHIPDDPLFFEKFYFTPGDLGFRCFDTRYARIAPLVCWDQWYPEGAAPGGAGRRADSVLSHRHRLASLRESEVRQHSTMPGETIQRSHAIANGVYVAAVNRVGFEGPAGATASSSGAVLSSPIRSAACSPKPRTITKRC